MNSIFKRVEGLINDHMACDSDCSKLRTLCPSVGSFFTQLPLADAFEIVDARRGISARRFVAPSFNDVRHVLSLAQLLQHARSHELKLITFDGDVTLYAQGQGISLDSAVLPHLLLLLARDIHVVILTAAGYPQPSGDRYRERFAGLLFALASSTALTAQQKARFLVLGGECNYLFRFHESLGLEWVDAETWQLDAMKAWQSSDITALLDLAAHVFAECINIMSLEDVQIIRKERAIGLVPDPKKPLERESLEEIVLAVQRTLARSKTALKIPFCAFSDVDVWVDVGHKAWGVQCLQKHLGGILPRETLHVGDQFLSLSGNDYSTRTVCTTLWVADPSETEVWLRFLLDRL